MFGKWGCTFWFVFCAVFVILDVKFAMEATSVKEFWMFILFGVIQFGIMLRWAWRMFGEWSEE